MKKYGVDGYLVPSEDEHQTEYVAPWFKRRAFISGFVGSQGTVIVTMNKAGLWVDGRYHSQADIEVDCNWKIYKYGIAGTPSIAQFIADELEGKILGADPRIISVSRQRTWLQSSTNVEWKNIDVNLVDEIWTDQPNITHNKIFIQPYKYSGQYFTDKIKNLRGELTKGKFHALIVDTLDDVAWLLNLRGDDIPYNPFFYAYIIVEIDRVRLYVDLKKVTDDVRAHLCNTKKQDSICVEIKDYNYTIFRDDISKMANASKQRIWITTKASVFIAASIPKEKLTIKDSPIQLPKAKKNAVELEGMRIANIRDGIAIMEFFIWLQKEVAAGKTVNELSAQTKLKYFKSKQKNYVSLSFGTIAGFGSNGAIIHYKANKFTNKQITDKSLFLLDSGAQFPEGSTDITRTIHLGTPTDFQKEAYTLVLKGAIGLARITFPAGTYGRNVDVLAREHLWRRGLGYRHGTGHGIGSFLSIHEGPGRINTGRMASSEATLQEGMVFSDEPGYYESGDFGIRLETAIVVKPATLKYKNYKKFYEFDVLTLVPFEKKLIDVDLLDESEIDWLNTYNKRIRDVMGKEIKNQGKQEVYDYMMSLTEHITKPSHTSSGIKIEQQNAFFCLALITGIMLFLH